MNKNTIRPKHTTHDPKLNIYLLKNLRKKTLIFNRLEQPIFNHQPLIVTETEKHYYYLGFSHNERIVTDHICCMEKSTMKKFIDVKKARWLKDLSSDKQSVVIKELIKNLSFVSPNKITDPIWLVVTSIKQESLPRCSILEVNYDEKQQCFLPDLIFCHPTIWDSNTLDWETTKLDCNIKDEIARIAYKFGFHFEKSMEDPFNYILIRLQADLEAILSYLTYLKQELEAINKSKHYPTELKPFYFKDFQEKTLIFNKSEQPIFSHQPLIITETEKHYYYLSISNNEESDEKIVTDHLFCMEKLAMKKFVNVEKTKSLKDLNFNEQLTVTEQLIKNLSYTMQHISLDQLWLLAKMLSKGSLPHCSVLEVNYDEKHECFLPDLVYCNPEIWDLWIKSEWNKTWLNYNIENETKRISEKFIAHLDNSIRDPLNSIWTRLKTDLELIVFYLKDLKEGLKKMNKNLNN